MADLIVDVRDHVMLVTINRPAARNTLGGTLFADLLGAVERARSDDDIRVVVTTAVGDKYWCPGSDLTQLQQAVGRDDPGELLDDKQFTGDMGLAPLSPEQSALDELGIGRWILAFVDIDKPMIAAVNGWAVGGGFGLCMLHDVRIASTRGRFASGFITANLGPEYGLSVTVPSAVGSGAAADILLSGRMIDAGEALRMGLVSEVVEPANLTGRALEYAATIAQHHPLAIRATKRALAVSRDQALRDRLVMEWQQQLICLAAVSPTKP